MITASKVTISISLELCKIVGLDLVGFCLFC